MGPGMPNTDSLRTHELPSNACSPRSLLEYNRGIFFGLSRLTLSSFLNLINDQMEVKHGCRRTG